MTVLLIDQQQLTRREGCEEEEEKNFQGEELL